MASAGQERDRIDAGRFPTSPGAVEALVAKTLQGQAKLEEFYSQRRQAKQPPPTPPRNVPRPSAVNPPAGPKKAPPCSPWDGKEPLFGSPAAQAPEASSAANPPEAQVLQHLQHEKLQKLEGRQVDTAKKFEGAPPLATTSAAGICKCRRER